MTLLAVLIRRLKTYDSCERNSSFQIIIENELLISSIVPCGLAQQQALIAYIKETQKVVNGTAKLKHKRNAQVVARKSPGCSLR